MPVKIAKEYGVAPSLIDSNERSPLSYKLEQIMFNDVDNTSKGWLYCFQHNSKCLHWIIPWRLPVSKQRKESIFRLWGLGVKWYHQVFKTNRHSIGDEVPRASFTFQNIFQYLFYNLFTYFTYFVPILCNAVLLRYLYRHNTPTSPSMLTTNKVESIYNPRKTWSSFFRSFFLWVGSIHTPLTHPAKTRLHRSVSFKTTRSDRKYM